MLPFTYRRTIRFQDTDAAGVVYFANVLSICHEAYEASLAVSGVDLRAFFQGGGAVIIPILHAEADYFQPMFCGECYEISVLPALLSPSKFEIRYKIHALALAEQPAIEQPEIKQPEMKQPEQAPPGTALNPLIAQALTLHLCIETTTRQRRPLPPEIQRWLEEIPSNADISAPPA
jgi:1,4-dihydroxy-2-naphthoyl-CoA hydrolase